MGKARCGSTFLLSLLNSHPRIRAFGEIFRDTHRIGWDLHPYDRDLQSPTLVQSMWSDPVGFLEEQVFGSPPPEIAAVGFKLFYYHAQDAAGRRLWDHLAGRAGLYVIHLKRRNTLRELLSLKRAEQTGEWARWQTDDRDVPPIELSVETCRREFEYARDARRRYDNFFAGRSMLQVAYEDLVRHQNRETGRVQAFLGVDVRELTPTIVKQSRDPLSRAIANYAQLEQTFRGTEWEPFFDESP